MAEIAFRENADPTADAPFCKLIVQILDADNWKYLRIKITAHIFPHGTGLKVSFAWQGEIFAYGFSAPENSIRFGYKDEENKRDIPHRIGDFFDPEDQIIRMLLSFLEAKIRSRDTWLSKANQARENLAISLRPVAQ